MQLFYVYVVGDKADQFKIDVTSNILDCTAGKVEEPTAAYQNGNSDLDESLKRKLIYFECFRKSSNAHARKRDITSWKNDKLLELLNFVNPERMDLSADRQALKSEIEKRG